jgi:hypothetical protein
MFRRTFSTISRSAATTAKSNPTIDKIRPAAASAVTPSPAVTAESNEVVKKQRAGLQSVRVKIQKQNDLTGTIKSQNLVKIQLKQKQIKFNFVIFFLNIFISFELFSFFLFIFHVCICLLIFILFYVQLSDVLPVIKDPVDSADIASIGSLTAASGGQLLSARLENLINKYQFKPKDTGRTEVQSKQKKIQQQKTKQLQKHTQIYVAPYHCVEVCN